MRLPLRSGAVSICVLTIQPKASIFMTRSVLLTVKRIFRADMAISLDVLLHLVEDDIFEACMHHSV